MRGSLYEPLNLLYEIQYVSCLLTEYYALLLYHDFFAVLDDNALVAG